MANSEIGTGKVKEDDDGGATENEAAWGTWEELILVSAVNRYGANCWESIARELQRQTSTNNLYNSQACELKFGELRRRFDAGEDADEEAVLRTMEEQLRRRRIEALKLEMKRRDSKIELIKSNLKKLEEEPEEEVDLVGHSDNRETVSNSAVAAAAAEEKGNVAAVSAAGDGGDDRARNQPESEKETCELENRGITGPELLQVEPELVPVQTGALKPASPLATLELTDSVVAESKLTEPDQPKEQSCQKQSQEVVKRRGITGPELVVVEPVQTGGPKAVQTGAPKTASPLELTDSVADSKLTEPDRPEEESCEMQSQETVKRRGIDGEDDDGAKPIAAATTSKTLIRVLDLIRSKKNSSFFENRLPSQETKEYREMIKQHMDLKTVEANINEGLYVNSESRFFRDLLLVFSNFTVFFPKASPEYIAAQEIQKIVIKEANPAQPKSERIKPAPISEHNNKEANPLIICRRRSSAYPTESLEAKSKQKESHQRHHHHDSKAAVAVAAVTIKKDTEKRGRLPLSRKESRPTSIKTSKKMDLNDDEEEEKLEGKGKNEGRSKTSQRTTRKMVRERKREDSAEDDKGEDFETTVKRRRMADNRVQERKISVSKNKEQPQIKVTKKQPQTKVIKEDTRLSRVDNKVRNSDERKSVDRRNISHDEKGGEEFQQRAKVEEKKAPKGYDSVRERKDIEKEVKSRVKTAKRTSKAADAKFKEKKKTAKEETSGDELNTSDKNFKNLSETDADDEEELVKKAPKGDNNVQERKDTEKQAGESRVNTAERTSKFKERKKGGKEEAGADEHKISDRNSKNLSETDDADGEEELVKKVKRTGRRPLKSDYFRRMKVVMESSSEEEEEDEEEEEEAEVPEVKKRDTRRREEPKGDMRNHNEAGKVAPKRDIKNHNEAGKIVAPRREHRQEKSIERKREKEKESIRRGGGGDSREQQTSSGDSRRGRPRKSSLPPPIVRDSRRVVAQSVKREPQEEEEEDLPPPRKPGRR